MNNKRVLQQDEIDRVIDYAYNNDYEPDECINLLNSKGKHSVTVAYVERMYKIEDSV